LNYRITNFLSLGSKLWTIKLQTLLYSAGFKTLHSESWTLSLWHYKLCTAIVSNFTPSHDEICSPSFKTLYTELVKNFGLWYYRICTPRLKNFELTHYIVKKVCSTSYKILYYEFIKNFKLSNNNLCIAKLKTLNLSH
jgi:hypothetical protein